MNQEKFNEYKDLVKKYSYTFKGSNSCCKSSKNCCLSTQKKQTILNFTHDHQKRVNKEKLNEFRVAVDNSYNELLKNCKDFDSLYNSISAIAKQIYGIGELTVYDLAVFIGEEYVEGVVPESVYLHSGCREGLKKVIHGYTGKRITKEAIEKNNIEFYEAIKGLACDDIETFLCVAKKELK